MSNNQTDINQIHRDMDYVMNDTEHFLKTLRGQKHLKRSLKKDVQNLKTHLSRLIEHLNRLEECSE